MPQELPEDDLPAGNRICQQQHHGAAFEFADQRIEGQQQCYQRQQEDRQAGQADDGHLDRPDAHIACWRAAEEGQGQRQSRHQHRRRQNPAIAQAVTDFPSGKDEDVLHPARPPSRNRA